MQYKACGVYHIWVVLNNGYTAGYSRRISIRYIQVMRVELYNVF